MQKRINPLDLNVEEKQVHAAKVHKRVSPLEVKEEPKVFNYELKDGQKRKFIFGMINKELLETLVAKNQDKKPMQVIELALLKLLQETDIETLKKLVK